MKKRLFAIQSKNEFILKINFVILIIALLLTACSGRNKKDSTSPSVSIKIPTNSATYTSTSSPLTISGTASDDTSVASVTWSSSTGDSGTCTGTTSWSASIPLTTGSNTITVTAKDGAENAGTATLTVTYLSQVTLSGTITLPSNYDVDTSLNDMSQTYTAHNTAQTAPSVQNPVILGGYVNRQRKGDVGSAYSRSDNADDYYSVALSTDDTITLYVSGYDSTDKYAVDMNLEICDSSGNVLKGEYGPTSSESITANSSNITNFVSGNTYYIHVQMDSDSTSGYSNYILSVGSQTSITKSRALSSTSEFVPGQVIVRFKNQGTTALSVQSLKNKVSSMNMNVKAGDHGRVSLTSFDLSDKTTTFKTLGIEDKLSIKAADNKIQKKIDTLQVVKALRKRLDVESADPNYIVHALDTTPNDTYYSSYQWNLPLINLPQAWDTTTGSSSVIVAVVDTGVLLNHPDLKNKLTGDGYDFVLDKTGGADPGDTSNTDGTSSFHGTHVSGIIAAETNNGIGVAGVSWNTKIRPVRVLGHDGGTEYDVLQGVLYAARLTNDSGTVPGQAADIINLSLGSSDSSDSSQAIYTQVRDTGVIVIAAAGNDAKNEAFYPAGYEGVVAVGAVDKNGNRASYSNYGSYVDVAAPGGDDGTSGYKGYVLSACGDDSEHIKDSSKEITYDYVWMAGTSMAAPHVAGVVALMKAVKSSLTPDDLDAFLKNKDIVDDIDDTSSYGYGLIDAYKAVLMASSGTVPTVLTVSPSALDFGNLAEGQTSSLALKASQISSGAISINSVSSDASWLTVAATSVDSSSGLGTYTATVNTTGLSSGSYSAIITFVSSSNTVTVSVQMQVSSGLISDVGPLWVLLWNPTTQKTIANVIADYDSQSGTYSYSLSNVTQGTYELYAGTDFGNTGYVGNNGDAFGAYQTVDQPVDITADTDISGLDFSVTYLVTLPTAASVNTTSRTTYPRLNKNTTSQIKQLAK
jgi:serine protease